MTIEVASQASRGAEPSPASLHAACRGDGSEREQGLARYGLAGFALFAAWLQSFFQVPEANGMPARAERQDHAPAFAADEGSEGPDRAQAAATDGPAPGLARDGQPAAPLRPMRELHRTPDADTGSDLPAIPQVAVGGAPDLPPLAAASHLAAQAAPAPLTGQGAAIRPADKSTGTPQTTSKDPDPPAPAEPRPARDLTEVPLDAAVPELLFSLEAHLQGLAGLEVSQISDLAVGDILREVPRAQIDKLIALAGDQPTGLIARIIAQLETPAARAQDAGHTAGLYPDASSGAWAAAEPGFPDALFDTGFPVSVLT